MRYLFPVLLLVGAILLCACANPSVITTLSPAAPDTQPAAPQANDLPAAEAAAPAQRADSPAPLDAAQPIEASAPTLSAGDFSEPPALTLFFEAPEGEARTARAITLSCSWTTLMPDGTAASLEACGMASLDAKEYLQAERVSLSPVSLDFSACRAENVTVRCWQDTAKNETDAEAEVVSVSIEHGLASFQPLPGGHIYEIVSKWQTTGCAHYCVWLVGAEM